MKDDEKATITANAPTFMPLPVNCSTMPSKMTRVITIMTTGIPTADATAAGERSRCLSNRSA